MIQGLAGYWVDFGFPLEMEAIAKLWTERVPSSGVYFKWTVLFARADFVRIRMKKQENFLVILAVQQEQSNLKPFFKFSVSPIPCNKQIQRRGD